MSKRRKSVFKVFVSNSTVQVSRPIAAKPPAALKRDVLSFMSKACTYCIALLAIVVPCVSAERQVSHSASFEWKCLLKFCRLALPADSVSGEKFTAVGSSQPIRAQMTKRVTTRDSSLSRRCRLLLL